MYDVIVVGGGPAGLSAALMLGRCRRRVLLCDLGQPRNRRSHAVHGYLTRDGIAPAQLNAFGRGELEAYGVELRKVGVTDARWEADRFQVTMGTDSEHARFLLIATGVVDDLPAVTGIEECYGRSVFHCPYCDGWEWRDRRLAVLGRGRDGAGTALALKTWSADIVLCTNGARLQPAIRERLARNDIAVKTAPIARLDHSEGRLSAVALSDGELLARDALFFAQRPASAIGSGRSPRMHAEPARHGQYGRRLRYERGERVRRRRRVARRTVRRGRRGRGRQGGGHDQQGLAAAGAGAMTLKAVENRPPEATHDAPAPPSAPEAPAIAMPVDIRSAALTLMAALALIVMLQYAQAMIIPIVLAVLISYALEPIVSPSRARPHPASARRRARADCPRRRSLRCCCTACAIRPTRSSSSCRQAARHMRETFENAPKPAGAIQQVQKAATELQKAADAAAPRQRRRRAA